MLNSLEGFGFTDSFGKYMKGTMKFRSMVINGSNRSRGATWGKRYVTGIRCCDTTIHVTWDSLW